MSVVMCTRFGGFGRQTPIVVAEKVFTKEYGRFGSEVKSSKINIIHAEELFDTGSYADIISRLDEIIISGKLRSVKILADYTVSGKTTIDMLREKKILVIPFLAINGDKQTGNDLGGYSIPIKELVTTAQRLLSEKRLKFAAGIAGVEELTTDLSSTYRTDAEYSDSVLNLCCAVWYTNFYIVDKNRQRKEWPKAGRL